MRGDRRLAGWLGGLAMLAICVLPFILRAIAAHHGTSLTVLGNRDPGLAFDYGAALSEAPGILAAALLAPLVGFRRWVALWLAVPIVGLCCAWIIGARAGALDVFRARQVVRQPISQWPVKGDEAPSLGRRAEDLLHENLKHSTR